MTADADTPASPMAPFRAPSFRLLWGTGLVANICMWMNDVTAMWMMTSLTTSPLWVALVQTAASLPIFLLALPSGTLADHVDRRRHLLATHAWLALVGLALSGAVFLQGLSAPLLLALTFANGVGVALRLPAFAATIPDAVERHDLPAAITLIGVSMNVSRIAGPLLAGLLIASMGPGFVFLLNGVMAVSTALALSQWRPRHLPPPRPASLRTLCAGIRDGARHVAGSRALVGILLRIWIFMFHSAALMGMLALLARSMKDADAGTFSALMGSMGAGAIIAAPLMPRVRHRLPRDRLLVSGTVMQAAAMLAMSQAGSLWLAVPAMLLFGMSWITTANTLHVAAHVLMADWVRARGLAIYQMTSMGAGACGAAFWGQLAAWTSVRTSLAAAAVCGLLGIVAINRLRRGDTA